jgi:hypothetical protein
MADNKTNDVQERKMNGEIEPISDDNMEEVAGGICSIALCSTPAPTNSIG